MFGPCLGRILNHFGAILEQFRHHVGSLGCILRFLGFAWGPFGINTRIETHVCPNPGKSGVHLETHFGTSLHRLRRFGSILVGSNFLIDFGRGLGGANVAKV